MPQLMWGPGEPLAITIEATTLAFLAAAPPVAFLSNMAPMTRVLTLGALYGAYNYLLVPRIGGDVVMRAEQMMGYGGVPAKSSSANKKADAPAAPQPGM